MEAGRTALTVVTNNIRVVTGTLQGGVANAIPIAVTVVKASIGSEYIIFITGTGTISGNCIIAKTVTTTQIIGALKGACFTRIAGVACAGSVDLCAHTMIGAGGC